MKKLIALVLAVAMMASLGGVASANNGDNFAEDILLMSETYSWTDPVSEGQVEIT